MANLLTTQEAVNQLAATGVTQTATANAPGTTTYTLNSAATTNAVSVKASAANLQYVSINNATAATKYFRLFNKATAPTVGTDIPVMVVSVPAGTSKEINPGDIPIRFTTGLGIAITNAAPANDATVVAAGDVQVLISYV